MHRPLQTRLHAIAAMATFACTQVLVQAAPALGQISFLVVGDWGRNGKSHQSDVAQQMGRLAAENHAAFVISTGDNFYNSGVTTVDSPQWQTSFERIYTAESLQIPWYAVLGNHDYRSEPLAEIAYTAHSERWKMPARYYREHQVLGDGITADFFFLDTEMLVAGDEWFGRASAALKRAREQQLEWLADSLAKSDARWKFVVGHHAVFSYGSEHGNTPALIHAVKPLLEKFGVQAYLNGHDHDMQHIVVNGVNYITSGAGSSTRPTGRGPETKFSLGETSGFLSAVLTPDELKAEFVDFRGKVVYAFAIPAGSHAETGGPKT